MWRKLLHAEPERKAGIMELDEHKAIHNKQLLIKCLIVGALILTGFMIHGKMGWEPATVALSGAAILLLISGLHVEEAFETVEWGTIFFFLGLFIMVGGLVKVGLIEKASMIILNKFGDDTSTLAYVILWFSAIASAVVDNIPYVATMCPLMNNLAEGVTGLPALEAARTPEIMPVWWALSLGACLGGNGTLVGASATVVVVGIAKRNGHKISFMEFTKYGFPVMIWTVAVAMVYLWFRYLRHLG
jgi:Na+/H+ antiporter NhaD/arsenite permease-like protein